MAKKMKSRAASSCSQGHLTEEIRKKAQELYEKNGRKPGRDMENWLEAERIVKSNTCNC